MVTKTSHLPIRCFLALLWAHPILHISTIRVNIIVHVFISYMHFTALCNNGQCFFLCGLWAVSFHCPCNPADWQKKGKCFWLAVERARVRNSSGTPMILSEISRDFLQYLQDSCGIIPLIKPNTICSIFFSNLWLASVRSADVTSVWVNNSVVSKFHGAEPYLRSEVLFS